MEFEHVKPMDIEKRSMEIIGQELAEKGITFAGRQRRTSLNVSFIRRQILNMQIPLLFSEHAVEKAKEALRAGATIVTDTKMAWSGINKRTLENLHGKACNFISDEDVAEAARQHGFTRSAASMDKAASLPGPLIFAIGNAPTALIRLYELIEEGKLAPALIIGVPVGFVNVVQAKELIMETDVPYIIARGRKGGSNVAAAICNALLYDLDSSRGMKKS